MHSVADAIAECVASQGMSVERVVTVPDLPDIYEVDVGRGRYLYVTRGCGHLFAGNLYQFQESEGLVSLTERARSAERREAIAQMPRSEMLVLEPPGDAKASVVVFTDVDCEFCRMFHGRIGEYLALGIEVRYVAYPSAGVGSATFKSMVSAWCADDRLGAITALKSGGTVAPLDCRNPVGSHFRIGVELGVEGTPTIVLPSGRTLSGYATPSQLASALGLD